MSSSSGTTFFYYFLGNFLFFIFLFSLSRIFLSTLHNTLILTFLPFCFVFCLFDFLVRPSESFGQPNDFLVVVILCLISTINFLFSCCYFFSLNSYGRNFLISQQLNIGRQVLSFISLFLLYFCLLYNHISYFS